MFRPRNLAAAPRRRAVILMVVLVLLTLFAIIGLAFVLYAHNEAEASRVYREANTLQDNRADIPPDRLLSYALGEFLFDVPDPVATGPNPTPSAAYSSMRGHSAGRGMWGWNADAPGSNTFAYNGTGRLHTNSIALYPTADDHALLSYVPYPADPFVRDPERLGTRASMAANPGPFLGGWNASYTYPDGNNAYLGAFDADGNILARSFWRPGLLPTTTIGANTPGGRCLPLSSGDPTIPLTQHPYFWTWFQDKNPTPGSNEIVPPYLKYASLRPRNADMAPGFPWPQNGGDVRNLPVPPSSPPGPPNVFGGNDSIWMDLDFPVQTAPDGTKFKPLFAFFIADLDGRINLNAHGNVRGIGSAHRSNQGWGKWEVNPSWLSANLGPTAAAAQAEWPQLFVGGAPAAPAVAGRYGPNKVPANPGFAPNGKAPRVTAQVDYDASDDTGPLQVGGAVTGQYLLPGQGGQTIPCFPFFPTGYNNGAGYERKNHPSNYNTQYPLDDDRRFDASYIVALFNSSGNSAAPNNDLGKLLSNNLGSFHVRNMLTTDSAGFDVPGLTPWIYDRNNTSNAAVPINAYGYGAAGPLGTNVHQAPAGGPVSSPAVALRNSALPANSEFGGDWRAIDAALGKIDLNRFLSPYPHQGQGNSPATFNSTPLCRPNDRFDDPTLPAAVPQQWQWAVQDRQNLANDIYRRLLKVTGVPAVLTQGPYSPINPSPQDLAPRRWLAQLAVNIVDFIDEDEMSTPFNFYNTADTNGVALTLGIGAKGTASQVNPGNTAANDPDLPTYWVFGTEAPKVVVHEVMAEYQTNPTAGNPFPVNVFVGLFNTTPTTAQLGGTYPNADPLDSYPVQLYYPGGGGLQNISAYIVDVADTNAAGGAGGLLTPPNDNDSPLGRPNWIRTLTDFSSSTIANIDGTAYTNTGGYATATTACVQPGSHFIVMPTSADVHGAVTAKPAGVVPQKTPAMQTSNMTYQVKQPGGVGTQWQASGSPPTPPNPLPALPTPTGNITDGPNGAGTTKGISVLLRRLANPHLPYDGNPLLASGNLNPYYNPYVTVDYMQGVLPQDETTSGTGTSVSFAKWQPYASHPKAYYIPPTPPMGKTACSFGGFPSGAASPFDWLVHLDRQLISPMELLQVSGFQPHELTTRFITPAGSGGYTTPTTPLPTGGQGVKFNHRVPWYNEQTRLYRLFEFLGTRDRAAGVSWGGRRPGMININTVWPNRSSGNTSEVFNALCDPQASNRFNPGDVNTIFSKLWKSRSPSLATPDPILGMVTGQDRPFLGFGVGNLPAADPQALNGDGTQKKIGVRASNTGIEDTLLRSGALPNTDFSSDSTQPRLSDVLSQSHPYAAAEVLTKIYGNVTTRSNVFAVWVTVGFFRVPSNPVQYVGGGTSGPVVLAEEIGASTGQNVRHKFFAIIDRSKMTISRRPVTTLAGAVPLTSVGQPVQVPLSTGSGTVTVSGMTYTNPFQWKVQPGTTLLLDVGTTNEETVIVQPTPATFTPPPFPPPPAVWITATFNNPHAIGGSVTIPGAPGPQPNFNIATTGTGPTASFSGVILAWTVLQ